MNHAGASRAQQENNASIHTNDTAYRIIDAPGNSAYRSSWAALAAEAGGIAFLIYVVDLTDTERMAVARAELDALICKMGESGLLFRHGLFVRGAECFHWSSIIASR